MNLLEYYPVFNARVHSTQKDQINIPNKNLRRQYLNFLQFSIEKGLENFEALDYVVLVYYLLLQDRIEDAMKFFARIKEEDIQKSDCVVQYDYMKGYLNFFNGHPKFTEAREIAEKYLKFPIIKWRNLFYQMANQISEFDGEEQLS